MNPTGTSKLRLRTLEEASAWKSSATLATIEAIEARRTVRKAIHGELSRDKNFRLSSDPVRAESPVLSYDCAVARANLHPAE